MACLAVVVVLGASLADPSPARAEIPLISPVIPLIGEVAGGVSHAVAHPVAVAVEAFLDVLREIFGGIEARLIAGVINALLAPPDFATGHVAALEQTTVAISAGMLTAVLTLSIVRYYFAGLSDRGSGGFEALQGVVRVTGAVGFIIVWPGIFNELVLIPKMFDAALLGSGSVQHNIALLFDAALVLGTGAFAIGTGVGLIFLILVGLIAAVVFLGLLWMKVLLATMVMFLYVSMPLAVTLWPVPELAWVAAGAMKALIVGLIVPCVWAILFALGAAVDTDILTWTSTHSILDTLIIRPLAGITLMLLCITIPRFLMRSAMIGPHSQGGGGRIWRTVTLGMFATRTAGGVGRAVAGAAAEGHPGAQRMISALPAQMRPPSEPGQGSTAARVVFGRSGYPTASAAGGPGDGSSGGEGGGGRGSSPEARKEGVEGGARARERAREAMSVPGIERPPFDFNTVNQAGKDLHARSRITPSSAEEVTAAMGQFSPGTQQALARFNASHPLKLREFAAQHLHSPSLTDSQRDALVTIGSARGAEVDEGMRHAIDRLDITQPAATGGSPTGGTGPDAGGASRGGEASSGGGSSPAGGGGPAAGEGVSKEGDPPSTLGTDVEQPQAGPPPPPPPSTGKDNQDNQEGLDDPFLD